MSKEYKIKEEDAIKILNYFGSKPYTEAVEFVLILQGLESVVEPTDSSPCSCEDPCDGCEL